VTRVPPDHGAGRGVPDRLVPARVFVGIGIVIGALAFLYGPFADEDAGKVLLTLTVAFCLWIGAYLWLRSRPVDAEEVPAEPEQLYLPHASIWPFGIGVGAFVLANGLLIGGWFYLPGLAMTVLSIAGFIRQTRSRT
jgi:putative exporter of polyketide antibiotics